MAAVLLTAREKSRPTWLLLLAAAVGLLAPFALLRDSGARCAFLSAVVLMVLGASLLSDLSWSPLLQGAALVGLAAGLVFHLHAYAAIGRSEAIRQDQMAQAVAQGADQVVLPTEGWAYCYCWQRNPSQMRANYFRQFYGLPADMELFFSPGAPPSCGRRSRRPCGPGRCTSAHRKLMDFSLPTGTRPPICVIMGPREIFGPARPMGRPLKGVTALGTVDLLCSGGHAPVLVPVSPTRGHRTLSLPPTRGMRLWRPTACPPTWWWGTSTP